MAPSGDDDHYQPKDAIAIGSEGTLVYGGCGLFAAAIQSALAKQNVGAFSVFTRFGGTIATFAGVGGVYSLSKTVAANLREKDDHWNEAIGGFLGGSIIGLRTLRMPTVLGCGAVTAIILTTYDYTGKSLAGFGRDPEVDEFERKEQMRKNRRRPIEETIAELGEGRFIHPPGYEERRRQRLKEKYGVDINPLSANPNVA